MKLHEATELATEIRAALPLILMAISPLPGGGWGVKLVYPDDYEVLFAGRADWEAYCKASEAK